MDLRCTRMRISGSRMGRLQLHQHQRSVKHRRPLSTQRHPAAKTTTVTVTVTPEGTASGMNWASAAAAATCFAISLNPSAVSGVAASLQVRAWKPFLNQQHGWIAS